MFLIKTEEEVSELIHLPKVQIFWKQFKHLHSFNADAG